MTALIPETFLRSVVIVTYVRDGALTKAIRDKMQVDDLVREYRITEANIQFRTIELPTEALERTTAEYIAAMPPAKALTWLAALCR